MKAVILSINPKVTLVDITHQVPKYNVKIGSYLLAKAARHFPEGVIHLAIVDPTVGGLRNPIIVETEYATFIGPDNGLLILAAEKYGLKRVYRIENKKYMNCDISSTFHGRDIFSSVAAYVSLGVKISDFGRALVNFTKIPFASPKRVSRTIEGEIIYLDGFGNIVTNIKSEHLMNLLPSNSQFEVYLENTYQLKLKLSEAYCEVAEGDFLAVIGSENFIEISSNKTSAAEKLSAKVGMKVKFMFKA